MSLSKGWRRHRGWIAVAAVLAIGVTVFVITRQAEPTSTAPTYTTEAATKGTLSVTVDGTGYLAVRDEVDVYPDVSGDIASLEADEGDAVKAGDVLYALDDTTVRKDIATAKSAKEQAYQSLERAELDLYQAKASLAKLQNQSGVPSSTVSASDITVAKKQVTIAKSGVSSASDSYDAAAANYTDAIAELDDLEVTAPCDGIVWSVNAEEGDAVGTSGSSSSSSTSANGSAAGGGTSSTASAASSSAPMTVARDGLMGVELSVNEVDVTTLKAGQDAEVQFDAVSDLKMTGTVDEVAKTGTVSSGVVSYSVWLTLDGTDKRIKPGMSASATIVTQVARNVLLVPNAAVKSATDGSSYVEVLADGATTPQQVAVVTGASSATQTAIDSGIQEGAFVVTKTTTASTTDSTSGSSSDTKNSSGAGGILMMGAGGPPAGVGGDR